MAAVLRLVAIAVPAIGGQDGKRLLLQFQSLLLGFFLGRTHLVNTLHWGPDYLAGRHPPHPMRR